MIIDRSKIKHTIIDSRIKHPWNRELEMIAGYVRDMHDTFRDSRRTLESIWTDAWSAYTVTDTANVYSRMQALQQYGKDDISWRHNVNTGKAFDAVETVHAYLMGSLFPNSHWLAVSPSMPGYDELARVLQYYLVQKLPEWKFMSQMASYVRQMLIVGTSAMALPWSSKSEVQYECLDMFDVLFDPTEPDVEDSPIIRRIKKTRAALIEGITKGFYSNLTQLDVVQLQPRASNGAVINDDMDLTRGTDTIRQFNGINVQPYNMRDRATIFEYWGDIHLPHVTYYNVVITVLNGRVIRLSNNTYKCGKPFVIGTYTPVVRQPHGISLLQPALGLIHELTNTTNQLLDGVELAINPMYTLERDSTLQPEEIRTEPGAVFLVDRHGVLQPIAPPPNNFGIGFQQTQSIVQSIDAITGAGPLVGSTQPRGGERVTAEEIKSVRDAGGNRLLGSHKHIELTSLMPMLKKTLAIVQQFTRVDDVVEVPDKSSKAVYFMAVGPNELQLEYKIIPRGADHVIEQQEYVNKRVTLLQTVASIPGAIEKLDLDKILEDILYNWGFDDPSVYMKSQESEGPTTMAQQAQKMGGTAGKDAMMAQVMADGGARMMKQTFGADMPEGANPLQLSEQVNNANANIG